MDPAEEPSPEEQQKRREEGNYGPSPLRELYREYRLAQLLNALWEPPPALNRNPE